MPSSNNAKRPNVVVFFTDQQRWDTMGLHGNPMDLTPNLDRMAMRGTHLAHCFTCQPVCGPARSCIQTGQYATNTGVFTNGIALREDARTLAHHFNDAGYHTGYIGKWHLAPGGNPVSEPNRGGYQYWLASNALEFTSEAYRTVMYDNDNDPVRLPGYRSDALVDDAIRYIDGHRDEPFFLFLSPLEPHFQNRTGDYPAPDGYRERYTETWTPPDLAALGGNAHQHLGGYYGMVKRLDEGLGRLLDALRSLDILDNTIVLFTSDHGCHFETRNSEYKRSCHESSIRVPGVLSGPGFHGGGRVEQMISLVDMAPTLMDAAGIEIPDTMDGRSVLPLTRGETDEWPQEVFIQISESQVGRAVRTQKWKYGVTAPDLDPRANPGADRYVEEYLYDLECDPYELENLAGAEPYREAADAMRDRLVKRMVEAGETEPTIEPAEKRPCSKQRIVWPTEANR